MAYCGPRALPLSQFLAWDPMDQQHALTWQAYESKRCSGCGTHPDEWTEPRAFHAERFTCPGCEQTERLAETCEGPGIRTRLANGPVNECTRCKRKG
jgi:hypothetical protein